MQLFAWHYPSQADLSDPDLIQQTLDRLGRMRATGLYLMAPEGPVLETPAPLQQFLARAEDAGLEVHLGLLPFSDPPQVTVEMNRRRYRYGQNGATKVEDLCPAWPENRILALNRARTLLEVFKPDGLHLDYARYRFASSSDFGPELEWSEDSRWAETYLRCQCPLCQSERMQLLGREASAWDERHPAFIYKILHRRDETMRAFMGQVKELCTQSQVKLSVAARVQYLNRAIVEGQDWIRWAEKGLVDVISPMNYSPDPEVVQRRIAANQRLLAAPLATILEGLGRRSSAGEATPEQLAAQVGGALAAGLPGVAIFSLDALTDRDLDLLSEFS